MIATGNHNFERFAALCNTPGGSQGVLTFSVYVLVGVDTLVAPYSGEAKGKSKNCQKAVIFIRKNIDKKSAECYNKGYL